MRWRRELKQSSCLRNSLVISHSFHHRENTIRKPPTTMSASQEDDGDTILDDRLSDYDCDEDRPNLTSGEAAAIREAEKSNRKIQFLILIATFFTSLVISSVKWYSSPYEPRHNVSYRRDHASCNFAVLFVTKVGHPLLFLCTPRLGISMAMDILTELTNNDSIKQSNIYWRPISLETMTGYTPTKKLPELSLICTTPPTPRSIGRVCGYPRLINDD